jgi:hypothetical protein
MVRGDEATLLQGRAPKLRAQGLKVLHGWLTCGSMMSEKPCPSPATQKGPCRLDQGLPHTKVGIFTPAL